MLPNAQSSCAATCDATPENETAYSSSALVEDSSAASKLVELQGKIELTMHRLDSTLREKEVLFESKLQDKLFEFETVTNDSSCLQRVDELDCDLNRLSDLSAQQRAEMDAKLEDIRFECQSIAAKYAQQEQTCAAPPVRDDRTSSNIDQPQDHSHCDVRAILQKLKDEMDFRLGSHLNELILGTLQAAFTPLSELVSEKLANFEKKLADG